VVAHGLELLTYVVRYSGDPAQLPPALRKVTADVDPVLPVFNVQPLQEYVSGQLGGFREYAMLLAVFGAVAVSLAVIGIYGIMAQSVAQRTQEIGVHMALGATPRDALWLVLRRGITLTTIGVVVGVVTAMILTDLLRSYLWEVTTTDPLTLSTVAAAVGVVSLLSSYVAARPILRVNPAIALQHGQ
jgi:ABC-type antimicrobial peptide transport system permease subunit